MDNPSSALLQEQATWLAPLRARLLRRVAIAHRTSVLDLGAGSGAITHELQRRSSGRVIALDLALSSLLEMQESQPSEPLHLICASGRKLPFPDDSFDMVFCQLVLMWIPALEQAISEARRVLQPGGVLLAFEPDYGGMIEHPPAIASRELWSAAIRRAGGDPDVGRKLPGILAAHGFDVRVDLIPEIHPPSPARFALLRGLPLTAGERWQLRCIERREKKLKEQPWARVVHLPFLIVTGTLDER